MSDPTHALRVLLERHRQTRDEALAGQRRAQAASDAAARQAGQLQQYRRDYELRWNTRFQTESTIELLRCYRSYSDRIGIAIEQQDAIAAHAAAQCEQARATLCEAELRCASVEKLIARRVGEQRLQAERRDQRQTDETAARTAMRRNGPSHSAPSM